MFDCIDIRLKAPICNCHYQDLKWGIVLSDRNEHDLVVTCKICETKVQIGHEHFVARFVLERKYPGGLRPAESSSKALVPVINPPNEDDEESNVIYLKFPLKED